MIGSIMLLSTTVMFAQRALQMSQNGDVRVAPDTQTYYNTNIIVEKNAEKYSEFFQQAIDHPGDTISFGSLSTYFGGMKGVIHMYVYELSADGIVFSGNTITAVGRHVSNIFVEVAWSVCLAMLSIVCVICGNVFTGIYRVITSAIVIVTSWSVVIIISPYGLFLTTTIAAVVASAIAFLACLFDSRKIYYACNFAFYLNIIAFIVLMYRF